MVCELTLASVVVPELLVGDVVCKSGCEPVTAPVVFVADVRGELRRHPASINIDRTAQQVNRIVNSFFP